MKPNVNIFFFMAKRVSFRVSCKHPVNLIQDVPLLRNTDIDCILVHKFHFFQSLKVFLINMVATLMMSVK